MPTKINLINNIYQPAEDSFLLQEQVRLFWKKRRIRKAIDMGTGTGIQAIEASKFSGEVLAVDINEGALNIARKNIEKKAIKNIKLIKSNLFGRIPKQKFDLIIFNPPYLPEEDNQQDKQQKSPVVDGGKKGHEVIELFLGQARNYLANGGAILLLFSTLTGDVEAVMKKQNYKFKKLAEEKLFMEKLFVYELRQF
ncbi:MAG TPA: HemK2/MTQ2 family protein methyltransferase [Candidatus Nanoarchaeia archaeon]|nr:HemK2/MTQ2 family protein methyltransferase [Candidatus Nanoarchaeia archaeon]